MELASIATGVRPAHAPAAEQTVPVAPPSGVVMEASLDEQAGIPVTHVKSVETGELLYQIPAKQVMELVAELLERATRGK